MNGAALLEFIKDRLALEGIADERLSDPALYRFATTARNRVRRLLAMRAPFAVQGIVTLEQDGRVWALPEATADPLHWVKVRPAGGGRPLTSTSDTAATGGSYEMYTLRSIRTRLDYSAPGEGLEAVLVTAVTEPVSAATAEGELGVPTPAHEAVGYLAAVLALTPDEGTDAANARSEFETEMSEVVEMFNGMHGAGARGLADAFASAFARGE